MKCATRTVEPEGRCMNQKIVALASLTFALNGPLSLLRARPTSRPELRRVHRRSKFWPAPSMRSPRMHMDSFSDSTLWEAAIDGLIEALDDPYAELFTAVEAEEWEEDPTGNYSGIGLQITMLNDEVTVTAVFRGFPAMSMASRSVTSS